MSESHRLRSWSCPPPRVDAARLLRIHKYTDLTKVRPAIVKAAEKAVEEAVVLSAPCASYVVTDIESLQ